jgi:predicted ATPase
MLKSYFRNSLRAPMLLLFDNFEHMTAAASLVADLLTASLHLKVLVTSRAPLHLYGEREFPVPTLEVPDLKSASTIEALTASVRAMAPTMPSPSIAISMPLCRARSPSSPRKGSTVTPYVAGVSSPPPHRITMR